MDEFWLFEAGSGPCGADQNTKSSLTLGRHHRFPPPPLKTPTQSESQVKKPNTFMNLSRIMNHTRRNTPHAPIHYQAYCDRCRRSFINDRALEQHLRASPRHNVCPGCDFDYITLDEMEECDCGSSAEEEEEEGSEYYDYEPGSAGTLSDDGGGGEEPPPPSSHLAERFANTYYSVPGAWNGGTSTGVSEASSSRRAQTQRWNEPVEEVEYEWDPTPFFSDPYSWYDSDEYGSEEEEEGAEEEESASHSEMSSNRLDESELGSDAGVQSLAVPVVTPYCQRCNRQFSTQNGLYQHHRMSGLHPWYCWTCKLDHDREVDLQRHVATVHGGVPQPGSGNSRQQQQQQQQRHHQHQQQQQQQPVPPPQQMPRWMEEFTAIVSGIRHISGARRDSDASAFPDVDVDADISTSTTRGGGGGQRWAQRWAGERWTMSLPPADSPPLIAPGELAQIPPPPPPRRDVAIRESEPVLLAMDRVSLAPDWDGAGGSKDGGGTSKASASASTTLVVSCPLCLDSATALTSTLCGHVFCKECITAAIQHKPECPVCRAFAHIKSLHPIFLNVITS